MRIALLYVDGRISSYIAGEKQGIAVVLSPKDKLNIGAMDPDATIYSEFPDGLPIRPVIEMLDRLKHEQASESGCNREGGASSGTGEAYTSQQPKIADRCPSCGATSLFIGAGGWITCGVIGCRHPSLEDAIAAKLAVVNEIHRKGGDRMTRAKFRCIGITKRTAGWAGPAQPFTYEAEFAAVTGDSPENKEFWAATPNGNIKLSTIREDHFEVGKEYYVDFSVAAA